MARIVKQFDPAKGLPFWYLDFDGDRYGPFSTREEADDYQDKEFGPMIATTKSYFPSNQHRPDRCRPTWN